MQNHNNENTIIDDGMFIEEKINGKVYLMARPNSRHLTVQGNLHTIFKNYFKRKKKKCAVILEMELYTDNDNYVQPDLMIFCKDNNEKKNKRIPLIVIEVLSDSTWQKDMTVKMEKYAELDIEEYWIIDPRGQRITIYKLNGGRYDLYKSYYYPVIDGFAIRTKIREEESEVIKEFSPEFFPDMTVLLSEVFDFDDLDIII